MPTESAHYVLSILNSFPHAMTLRELKSTAARISKLNPSTVESDLQELIRRGSVIEEDNKYLSKKHIPKIRMLDADWQW